MSIKFDWVKSSNGDLSGSFELPTGKLHFTIKRGTTDNKVYLYGLPITSYPDYKDLEIKSHDEAVEFCNKYLEQWFVNHTQPLTIKPVALVSSMVEGQEFKHIASCKNFNVLFDPELKQYVINYLEINDQKEMLAESESYELYKVALIQLEKKYYDFVKKFLEV